MVEVSHVDESDVDEFFELLQTGVGEVIEHAHVLPQQEHPCGFRVGEVDVLPGLSDDRVDAAHAGPHADVVFVGEGDLPHPVDAQREPGRMRLELDDHRAGTV